MLVSNKKHIPKIRYYTVLTTQIISYPAWRFSFTYLFHGKQKGDPRFKENTVPSIVYSNHQSMLDAPMIIAALPFQEARKVMPVFTMTADKYYYHPAKLLILYFLGGFPTNKSKRHKEQGIPFSKQIIHSGGSVIIFPQGHRTTKAKYAVKRGLGEINTSKMYSLAASINWCKSSLLNRRFTVCFSAVSKKKGNAEELFKEVLSLSD